MPGHQSGKVAIVSGKRELDFFQRVKRQGILREKVKSREFGCSFFQTGKTGNLPKILKHRKC